MFPILDHILNTVTGQRHSDRTEAHMGTPEWQWVEGQKGGAEEGQGRRVAGGDSTRQAVHHRVLPRGG